MTASDRLSVTGMGLACSLGLSAPDACAAALAGLTRPTPMPGLDVFDPVENEGTDLFVHAASLVTEGFEGVARFARLGVAALEDVLRRTDIPDDGRTGICVALPSGHHLQAYERWALAEEDRDDDVSADYLTSDARRKDLEASFIPLLKRYTDIRFHPSDGVTLFEDEAGFGSLLRIAHRALEGGGIERCLVGGIDTSLDPLTIRAMGHAGALLTPENAAGAMPGEAAAFLLVERAGRDLEGVTIGGVAQAQGLAFEGEQRPSGVALSQCLGATRAVAGQPLKTLYTALDGTAHRSFDWGCALVRLSADGPFEPNEIHPAISFGGIGAAMGPMAVCLDVHARGRGWTSATSAVWLASDTGLRSSFFLSN